MIEQLPGAAWEFGSFTVSHFFLHLYISPRGPRAAGPPGGGSPATPGSESHKRRNVNLIMLRKEELFGSGFLRDLNHVAVAEPEIGDGLGISDERCSPATAATSPAADDKSCATAQPIGRGLGFGAIENTFEFLAGYRIEARDFDAGKVGGGKDQIESQKGRAEPTGNSGLDFKPTANGRALDPWPHR